MREALAPSRIIMPDRNLVDADGFPIKEDSGWAAKKIANARPLDPSAYQQEIIAPNYDLNLADHGKTNLGMHILRFINDLTEIAKTRVFERNPSLMLLGCGDGRMAVIAIEMAKKLGIKNICFNDLLDHHITKTKAVIEAQYGSSNAVDGVSLDFAAGDCSKVLTDIKSEFGAIIMRWFVSAEFVDLSEPGAMEELRINIFTKIAQALAPDGGTLVDDQPFGEIGAYRKQLDQTYQALEGFGWPPVTQDLARCILASDFRIIGEGSPVHLRFVPDERLKTQEMAAAGLRMTRLELDKMGEGFLNQQSKTNKLYLERTAGTGIIETLRRGEIDMLTSSIHLATIAAVAKEGRFSQTTHWQRKA